MFILLVKVIISMFKINMEENMFLRKLKTYK